MNGPRYILARYIPDLQRMEPRNIGVIVWSSCGVDARFVAEGAARTGQIDGRSLPDFASGQASAFKQWVEYWRRQIVKDEIEPVTGGDRVPASDPTFLNTLMLTGRGNFILERGGDILDLIDADNLADVTDYLFEELVDTGRDDVRDPTLDQLCNDLIKQSQLWTNTHFARSGLKVPCPVKEGDKSPLPTMVTYEFSYGYQNGSLQRLYQRVPLSSQKATRTKTVHDAAWMFEKVIQNKLIASDQCGVLVYVPKERFDEQPELAVAVDELESVVPVFNISTDRERVLDEFRRTAQLAAHH